MQVAVLPNAEGTTLKKINTGSELGLPLPKSGKYTRTKRELLGCFLLLKGDLQEVPCQGKAWNTARAGWCG